MRVSCFLFQVKGTVSAILHLNGEILGKKQQISIVSISFTVLVFQVVSNKLKMVFHHGEPKSLFCEKSARNPCNQTFDWKVRKPCIHLQAWFWTSQLRLRVLEGFWRRLWQKFRLGLRVGCKICKVSGSLVVTRKASSLKWDTMKHLRFISTRQDELAS